MPAAGCSPLPSFKYSAISLVVKGRTLTVSRRVRFHKRIEWSTLRSRLKAA
jgi:hypothetical protein